MLSAKYSLNVCSEHLINNNIEFTQNNNSITATISSSSKMALTIIMLYFQFQEALFSSNFSLPRRQMGSQLPELVPLPKRGYLRAADGRVRVRAGLARAHVRARLRPAHLRRQLRPDVPVQEQCYLQPGHWRVYLPTRLYWTTVSLDDTPLLV